MPPPDEVFDLLVIGAGITGAGIARDASLRGLRVLLIDKGRFASGTSSKSSKLIHGGIRYLEQFQIGLVKEACRERAVLLKTAPRLVQPLSFILPVYRGAERGKTKISLGLTLYEWLAGSQKLEKHRWLTPSQVLQAFPDLLSQELKGGFLFYDAQTDDEALVRAIIRNAESQGCTAREFVEFIRPIHDGSKIAGAVLRDLNQGKEFSIRCRLAVNAAGPWVDRVCGLDGEKQPKLRPTKGAHIVLDSSRVPSPHGLLLFTPQDQRVFFVLPWKGQTLVGTTDTDYEGDPDEVKAEPRDLDYLLDAVAHYFPNKNFTRKDILSFFAGLRPLLRADQENESDVSREHQIFDSSSGLVTIAGGKLTTYRKMAEQLVDHVVAQLQSQGFEKPLKPCQTAELPIEV